MISGKDSGPIPVRRRLQAGGQRRSLPARAQDRRRRHGHRVRGHATRSSAGAARSRSSRTSSPSNPKIVRRFFNEARAVAKIRHENIIDVFDFGQPADGALLLHHGAARGRRARDELQERARCRSSAPAHRRAGRARAGGGARAPASSTAISSPTTILVRRAHGRDFVKVLDFGIAKLLAQVARPTTPRPGW